MKKTLLLLSFLLLFINGSLQAQIYKIWNTSNSSIPTNFIFSIFIDNEGIIWLGSNDKGLIKYDGVNFLSYNTTNSPMKSDMVRDVVSDNFNNLWIGTIKQGAGNEGALMKFDKVNNWLYYNTTNSGIASGNNWSVAVDRNNVVWAAWSKLSKFDGISWVIYDSANSTLKIGEGIGACREINIDKFNNKWIAQDGNGLCKLENDTNWTLYSPVNSGLGYGFINKIREDNSGNLWMTLSYYGLQKFNPINNQWQSWTPKNSALNSGHPWGLHVDNKNVKWFGSSIGDSLGAFDGSEFQYYPPYSNPIYDIKQDKFGNLWIATQNGLLQFNKNGIVGINNQTTSVPSNFSLSQNYPNPFNPSTIINYQLTINSFVTLNVYDINGKLVKELINKKQNAGNYSIDFDGSGLPSGTYIYRLQTGDFSETKKMVLLK